MNAQKKRRNRLSATYRKRELYLESRRRNSEGDGRQRNETEQHVDGVVEEPSVGSHKRPKIDSIGMVSQSIPQPMHQSSTTVKEASVSPTQDQIDQKKLGGGVELDNSKYPNKNSRKTEEQDEYPYHLSELDSSTEPSLNKSGKGEGSSSANTKIDRPPPLQSNSTDKNEMSVHPIFLESVSCGKGDGNSANGPTTEPNEINNNYDFSQMNDEWEQNEADLAVIDHNVEAVMTYRPAKHPPASLSSLAGAATGPTTLEPSSESTSNQGNQLQNDEEFDNDEEEWDDFATIDRCVAAKMTTTRNSIEPLTQKLEFRFDECYSNKSAQIDQQDTASDGKMEEESIRNDVQKLSQDLAEKVSFQPIDASIEQLSQELEESHIDCKAVKSSSAAAKQDYAEKENEEPVTFEEMAGKAASQKKKQITLTQGCFLQENSNVDEAGTKCNDKATESNGTAKKQVTLTQGYFVEAATDENVAKCAKQCAKSMESVEIRKRGTIREMITYSKGEVWQSADPKYEGFAFTLGGFHVVSMQYEAEISQMWMRLENTYIESEEAARVIEKRPDCSWVIVEEHPLIPKARRIQLKTLCNKLAEDDMPQDALHYIENAPTYAFFNDTTGKQFTPPEGKVKPIALDVFAGGGFMSLGLQEAGFNVKYKVDKDESCVKTLRRNFSKAIVIQKDITKFLKDLKRGKETKMGDLDKIILNHGSPPCQGFSGANTSGGDNDFQNKECTLDYLKVVDFINSPFVSMENVPGMAMERKLNDADMSNKEYLQKAMGTLLSSGYQVSITMAFASDYGDPQKRKRLLLLGAKNGYKLPSLPKPTHGEGEDLQPIVSVWDALHDLDELDPNGSGKVYLNGKEVRGHYNDDTTLARNDNDLRLYAEHPLPPQRTTAKTVRKQNRMIHYNRKRCLTLLEYKRLMSCPDSHVLMGTKKEMRDQVGNGVPCRFAAAIGKAIMESYRLGTYSTSDV